MKGNCVYVALSKKLWNKGFDPNNLHQEENTQFMIYSSNSIN